MKIKKIKNANALSAMQKLKKKNFLSVLPAVPLSNTVSTAEHLYLRKQPIALNADRVN